jgi:hypothetical protein
MDFRVDRLLKQCHIIVELWMHCLGSAEKMLIYSHSRNPTRVHAHMHRHARVPIEPYSSEE